MTTARIELRAEHLPAPPGLNGSYKIVSAMGRDGKRHSSLALTDAALRWQGICADAIEASMRQQGLKPMHQVKMDARSGLPKLVPATDSPWFVTPYYRYVTSRADADAPVKHLIDSALMLALGVSDTWVGMPIPLKFWAMPIRGGKLIEKPRVDIILILDPVQNKRDFNTVARERDVEIRRMLGGVKPFPKLDSEAG